MEIVFIIVAILILLFFGGTYVIYRFIFYSPIKGQNDIHTLPKGEAYDQIREQTFQQIDRLAAIPYEEVFIKSYDGLQLAGKYYHVIDGAPLAICFHGYRSTAIRDMSGIPDICKGAGLNYLLIDQRAHDKSQGKTITFGVKERYDCVSWVNYAAARFGENTPIFLFGISMGAATVLLASALELPKSVRGILADCPYTSPADIIRKVCKDIKILPKLVYPLIKISARLYGGFSPDAVKVTEAIKQTKIPVLLIHGEKDSLVPKEMSAEIANACPLIEYHLFPNAEHGISGVVDKNRYDHLTAEFIKKLL